MPPALLFLAAALYGCQVLAYPSAYPFENEAYMPPDLPGETPTLTYDDSDTGGYYYTYAWSRVLSYPYEDMNPGGGGHTPENFCWTAGGMLQYTLIHTYSAPPILPQSLWNCTNKEIFFTDDDFTGTVNGDTVCSLGSCCQNMIGRVKYADDQATWHSWLDGAVSVGTCEDTISEAMYCQWVNGHGATNCFEWMQDLETRLYPIHCFDVSMIYWLGCKVIASTVLDVGFFTEPPIYLEKLTSEENILLGSTFYSADKICLPNSYYNPDTIVTSETSGSDASAGATSGARVYSLASLVVVYLCASLL